MKVHYSKYSLAGCGISPHETVSQSAPGGHNRELNKYESTHRYKNVEQILKGGKLRDEFLHNFTEGLKD